MYYGSKTNTYPPVYIRQRACKQSLIDSTNGCSVFRPVWCLPNAITVRVHFAI